jgi:hypothetical protein
MATGVILAIRQSAEAALANRHGRSFIKAVRAFVAGLGLLPDAAPTECSRDTLMNIRDLANRVVDEIEDRLEDDDDSLATQRELAGAIYRIRRTLEEIDLWERHFLRPPGGDRPSVGRTR